ncbi:MAG: C40 family peptidase [Gammaproteobacteria bacterium]|jgi:cell wall-associated NlpC family hydrolase
MHIPASARFLALVLVSLALGACSGGSRDISGKRLEVVTNALAQVGTPYRYGGAGPDGFDCSGLVYFTHGAAGIRVPRVTTAQKRAAKRVSRSRLQPGDLVFFRTGSTTNHVGIMIDSTRFVHAPSSGKRVRTSHLTDNYWRRNFTGAATYLH